MFCNNENGRNRFNKKDSLELLVENVAIMFFIFCQAGRKILAKNTNYK